MIRYLYYLILFLGLLSGPGTTAQVRNQYNLNIYNGLPDNHVYNCLIDKHGYLWMTTPKGVVRYNGYETRVFDLASGLPSEDVWRLYEDKKGRIWLGSITNSIGYIYNSEYKKAVIPGFNKTVYPGNLKTYMNDALMFSGTYMGSGKDNYDWYVFLEHNDTFSIYQSRKPYFIPRSEGLSEDRLIAKFGDSLYRFDVTPLGIKTSLLCPFTTEGFYQQMVLHNNIVQYDLKGTELWVLNLTDCSTYTFSPSGKNEQIFYAYALGDTLSVYLKSEVCSYDTGLHLRYRLPIRELVADSSVDGDELLYILNDSKWGRSVTTKTHGIYITYPDNSEFRKSSLNFSGYEYIGNLSDSLCCWWNNSSNAMATIRGDKVERVYQFEPPIAIRKVIPYNKDYALVFDGFNVCILNLRTGGLKYILKKPFLYPVEGAIDTINNTVLFVEPNGIYRYTVDTRDGNPYDLTYAGHYSDQRYKKIAFLPSYQLFAGHNSDHVFIIYKDGTSQIIPHEVLLAAGIHNIELITSDRFGNIYIKQDNSLSVYVPRTGTFYPLLQNFILNGSQLTVKNDRLIVAGKFGLAIMAIRGLGQLQLVGLYNNIKGLNYNFVYNVKYFGSSVLLNTDKGLATVDISAYEGVSPAFDRPVNYNFIAINNKEYHDIQHGDTLVLNQADKRITWDVINVKGYGPVVYSYRLKGDSAWTVLQGAELFLPDLAPDEYHAISVMANDLAWRSTPIDMYIYVQPYWWQTTVGIRVLWIVGIVLALLGAAIIILITRRVVTRKNERRNLQLELELKAIYSQINPHFIFNTLSTALFFIKTNRTKEAYSHIIKFSKLLRAYIRSSRNKYVSIADEIASLNNYVELQQVRFENKFDYLLQVDENIALETIKIPSLLLQPLVENAINHGIFHNEKAKGYLKVSFEMNSRQNELICRIEDNGVGRAASKQINRTSMLKRESFGSDLVKDLINIFNRYEEMHIDIEYIDKRQPETGTIVILRIKDPVNGR